MGAGVGKAGEANRWNSDSEGSWWEIDSERADRNSRHKEWERDEKKPSGIQIESSVTERKVWGWRRRKRRSSFGESKERESREEKRWSRSDPALSVSPFTCRDPTRMKQQTRTLTHPHNSGGSASDCGRAHERRVVDLTHCRSNSSRRAL